MHHHTLFMHTVLSCHHPSYLTLEQIAGRRESVTQRSRRVEHSRTGSDAVTSISQRSLTEGSAAIR